MIELTSLFIYPVKSCRGIALTESAFGPDGLTHDREFLAVDEEGCFLTQRTMPALARIETALSDEALILHAQGLEELRVPWNIPAKNAASAECEVTIWRDKVIAFDTGEEAANWLARALGSRARLVRRGPSYARYLPGKRVPPHVSPDVRAVPVSFADAFPVLIVSEESLADLNTRLDDPLPMNRFRPNLVIRGCSEPFAEDTWATFRVGADGVLHTGGACVRCITTTIDQQTGLTQGKEPLRTLALYRRNQTDGNGVIFGQNVIPDGKGHLRVGDGVEVISMIVPATTPHFPIPAS